MSQFKILGNREDLVVGDGCSITREPWPFFDTKGGGIVFGDNVVISSGVYILTHSHQFSKSNWRDLPEITPGQPTIVSDDVFLGINAVILPSCKRIGRCSVIGAGSIVTEDVPDYEIWSGNPARKVKDVECVS